MLARAALVILALALLGCSSAGVPSAGSTPRPPVSSNDQPPRSPAASGDLTLPSFPTDSPTPTAEDFGATIRVVNVWAEPAGLGPTVELRTVGADGVVLARVAPGEVSDFVSIPKAKFGGEAEGVTVVEADAPPGTFGLGPGQVAVGDRITLIVHGYEYQGDVAMKVEPVWEAGEPGSGLPWPDVDPTKATLKPYLGPLEALPREESLLSVRTAAGECLEEVPLSSFRILPAGRIEIVVGTTLTEGCTAIDPDIGQVTIDASPGQRFVLVVWGPSGNLGLLLLDMGTAEGA